MMNPVSKTKRQPTISLGKDEEERGAFMTRIEIVKRVWFYYDDF
jgi:predicted transcriptional regulator